MTTKQYRAGVEILYTTSRSVKRRAIDDFTAAFVSCSVVNVLDVCVWLTDWLAVAGRLFVCAHANTYAHMRLCVRAGMPACWHVYAGMSGMRACLLACLRACVRACVRAYTLVAWHVCA